MDPQVLASLLNLSQLLAGLALLFVISLALISFTVYTLNIIRTPDYKKLAQEAEEEVNGQFQD